MLKKSPVNKDIIKEVCKINQIKIQVGGGVRTLDHIKKLIDFGVDKVILGTAAIENLKFLQESCDKFNKKIALSIDVRNGYLALSGWEKQTTILATDFIKKIQNINLSRIIYTDIDRDGTKSGPNIEQTVNFSNLSKVPTLVSGGISSIEDVINIKKENYQNIEGIIIGKAIYDGNIDIKKLIKII